MITAATGREPWFLVPAHRHGCVRLDVSDGLSELLSFAGPGFFFTSHFSGEDGLWDRSPRPGSGRPGAAGPSRGPALAGRNDCLHHVGRPAARPLAMDIVSGSAAAILAMHFYVSTLSHLRSWCAGTFTSSADPINSSSMAVATAFWLQSSFSWPLALFWAAFRNGAARTFWRRIRTPVELWLLALFATAMVWGDIVLPEVRDRFYLLAAAREHHHRCAGLVRAGLCATAKMASGRPAGLRVSFFAGCIRIRAC